jgi:prolycopene isomerase
MHTMSPLHQVFDAVIFGSGLAGLSCARRLALLGQKVAVIEKNKALGGHLLPFERAGTFFEVGLHYIADTGQGSHFSDALRRLNVQFDEVRLDDHFETLVFEDGAQGIRDAISYSTPVERFAEELKGNFPENKRAIDSYFSAMEMIWQLMKGVDFPVSHKGMLQAFLRSHQKLRLGKLAFQTLGAFFDELGIHGKLREILAVHHLLIGVPPSRVSAVLHMLVQRYYFENACFVAGGGQAMIDALEHKDVQYLTGRSATFAKIHAPQDSSGGARFRIETDLGEVFFAKNIVWTPDPRLLETANKNVALPALLRERLKGAEAPAALVVGYFATRKELPDYGLQNRNYWLMGSLDSEQCYRRESPDLLAAHAPVYISTGSLRDPHALKPDNKLGARGVFQAMFLCPPDARLWGGDDVDAYRKPESRGGFGREYRLLKERTLKTLTHRLETVWPALAGELVWSELGTPLTHRRYLHSMTLNGYGFAPTVSDFLWKRPGTSSGEDGLYLCGAHVRPAHGIVTALLNGVGLAERLAP